MKSILDYDPISGLFTWKVSPTASVNIGDIAGSINGKGYIVIRINNNGYLAHRLAWFYVHGYFPEYEVDHNNRIKHDNRLENLKEATRSCNQRNIGLASNNKSGVKGVSFDKRAHQWRSDIVVNTKLHYLGRYNDFNDAVCARLAAEQCLDWPGCDSNSPAFQYVKKNIL